jgi:hypothetical protein
MITRVSLVKIARSQENQSRNVMSAGRGRRAISADIPRRAHAVVAEWAAAERVVLASDPVCAFPRFASWGTSSRWVA